MLAGRGGGLGQTRHYCNHHHLLSLTPITINPLTTATTNYDGWWQWWVSLVVVVGGWQFMTPVGGSCGQTRHYHNPPPAITINPATIHHCHHLLWWLAEPFPYKNGLFHLQSVIPTLCLKKHSFTWLGKNFWTYITSSFIDINRSWQLKDKKIGATCNIYGWCDSISRFGVWDQVRIISLTKDI